MGAEGYDDAAMPDAGPVIVPARGLLFDADGVLVDSDESIERSWVRWAHRWDHDPVALAQGAQRLPREDAVHPVRVRPQHHEGSGHRHSMSHRGGTTRRAVPANLQSLQVWPIMDP